MDYKDERILLLGSTGFLGTWIGKVLKERGYEDVVMLAGSKFYDLREQVIARSVYSLYKPSVVICCASSVGGITFNKRNPAKLIYDNLIIGVNSVHEAYKSGVKKYINIGTICSYPKFTNVPFKESDLWTGFPEESNAPYGIAKKTIMEMLINYEKEYGFSSVNLLLSNLFGPGDSLNLEKNHVIPAMIVKFLKAQKEKKFVVLYGSGQCTREFLFVRDAANGIVDSFNHNGSSPINLGTGQEITINDLAELIAKKIGFKNTIVWDGEYPDGQPRRCVSTEKAEKSFGFRAKTSLSDGLDETINWVKKELNYV